MARRYLRPDSIYYKEAFNKYVDQILTNFDPLPPRVDKRGHFTTQPSLSKGTKGGPQKKYIHKNVSHFSQHNTWVNSHTLSFQLSSI